MNKDEYAAYLQSREWLWRRCKVWDREGGRCQGCAHYISHTDQVGHVHHLTYDRIGCELLCDLVLLCPSCHDVAHDRDRVETVMATNAIADPEDINGRSIEEQNEWLRDRAQAARERLQRRKETNGGKLQRPDCGD